MTYLRCNPAPKSQATNGGRTFSWGQGLMRAAPGHYMLCSSGEMTGVHGPRSSLGRRFFCEEKHLEADCLLEAGAATSPPEAVARMDRSRFLRV